MIQKPKSRPTEAAIEIPKRVHPVLAMLTFIPVMIVILSSLALAIEPLPPVPLIVLMVLVIGCCGVLSVMALRTMLGGQIEFLPEGLKVSQFLKEDIYLWSSLEACKVMPATGTFGDDALVDMDNRVGAGLFLNTAGRRREHDLDADVILCAGDKVDVQTLMRISEKVNRAIKRGISQDNRPAAPVRVAAPARQFRQQRSHDGSVSDDRKGVALAGDPVAAFRQRARGADAG